MRIVAGAFGGRRLHTPRGLKIRPTPDRVREAVFSIIAPRLPGARIMDLFAGTGAMGLEALSRGASHVIFVDENPGAIRLIRTNAALCGIGERAAIVEAPVERALRRFSADKIICGLVFLDPPYGKGLVERTLPYLAEVTHPGALAVAEHHVKDILPDTVGSWMKSRERRYGDTAVSFFLKDPPI